MDRAALRSLPSAGRRWHAGVIGVGGRWWGEGDVASQEGADVEPDARYRVRPTVKVAIGLLVIYAIVLAVIQQTSGVEYDEFTDNAGNAWRAPVLSLGVGAVLLLAFLACPDWARSCWQGSAAPRSTSSAVPSGSSSSQW